MSLATYLYFSNFLSKDECNRIVKEGEKDLKISLIGAKAIENFEYRKTEISFIKNGSSVQDLMQKAVNHLITVGVQYYGCRLTDVEPIQYAKYKEGMFYDWHVDTATTLDDLKFFKRDVSASLVLSDKKEYTGGSLQMILANSINQKTGTFHPEDVLDQEQGTLVVFPSSFIHRVTKVETGTRRSLVLWARAE